MLDEPTAFVKKGWAIVDSILVKNVFPVNP
jgi:hypothetical protein